MVFGFTGVVLAPIYGYLTEYLTQVTFIVFMLMVSISNSIFMLTWIPDENHLYVIFFMAVAFGVSQAYGNCQLLGLYVTYITENKNIFCISNMFQNIGFLLGFLLSRFTCTYLKAYVYFSLSSLSLICYVALIRLHKKSLIKS